MPTVKEFSGYYRFLSNFWPCKVQFDGDLYDSAEHAYQAAKTLDQSKRLLIAICQTPGGAKRAGKLIHLRPDWEKVKDQVMLDIVRDKFARNPELAVMLRRTEPSILEEGNYWGDRYWGVCPAGTDNGLNKLGKILMQVRKEIHRGST